MNLWDTHCHLYSEYYSSLNEILEDAKDCGVKNYIVSGVDRVSNSEILSILSSFENCYGVVGIHPEEIDSFQSNDFLLLKKMFHHNKIIGIGEIGLDYHYTELNKEKQKEIFEEQLKLAEEYQLPVVIHSRDATQDTIDILKKYSVKGVIHSFSGSLETAKIYIDMGFKLGINGVITFKNCKLKEILPEIFPYIILETDSPYLTPHPNRGKQNSPKYIRDIAEFIAEELKIPICQVEKVTTDNVYAIFDKLNKS